MQKSVKFLKKNLEINMPKIKNIVRTINKNHRKMQNSVKFLQKKLKICMSKIKNFVKLGTIVIIQYI